MMVPYLYDYGRNSQQKLTPWGGPRIVTENIKVWTLTIFVSVTGLKSYLSVMGPGGLSWSRLL